MADYRQAEARWASIQPADQDVAQQIRYHRNTSPMNLSRFRNLTQLSSLVLGNSYFASVITKGISTGSQKGACVPFLNCYSCPSALFACPIGTIQHFAVIHTFPLYPLALLALVGLGVGRMTCGWLCPFGLIQDLLYKLPTATKIAVPQWANLIKYLVLISLVIVIPYLSGEPWFSKLCPAGTLLAAIPIAVWNPANPVNGTPLMPTAPGLQFMLSTLILLLFLIWFALSKRPFCRVVCPLGAIFSFFNGFSFVRLQVGNGCDTCGRCQDYCPMGIKVYENPNSAECIRCLECSRCAHVTVAFQPLLYPKTIRQTVRPGEMLIDS